MCTAITSVYQPPPITFYFVTLACCIWVYLFSSHVMIKSYDVRSDDLLASDREAMTSCCILEKARIVVLYITNQVLWSLCVSWLFSSSLWHTLILSCLEWTTRVNRWLFHRYPLFQRLYSFAVRILQGCLKYIMNIEECLRRPKDAITALCLKFM